MTYDYVIGMDVGKYFHHACGECLMVCVWVPNLHKEIRDLTPVW